MTGFPKKFGVPVCGTFDKVMRHYLTMSPRRGRIVAVRDGRVLTGWPTAHRTRIGVRYNQLIRMSRRIGSARYLGSGDRLVNNA